MNVFKTIRIAVTTTLLLLYSISIEAQNFNLSKHMTKLSEWDGQVDAEDNTPEMVISGEIIHTIWVRYVAAGEAYLYYRRSVNLGETWEDPKLIHKFKDGAKARTFDHRKLAVDGSNVYIAAADYDYPDKGTGRIFFYQSSNSGSSFSAGKILSQTEGGYRTLYNCNIKATNGKIAIAYQGPTSGVKKGTWLLYSSNGGSSFTDTQILDASTSLSDLYFDGNQAIILHGYSYYMYGLNTGRVWVSTTQNGTTFTTHQVSHKYTTQYGEAEKCLTRQNNYYSSKISKTGNTIAVVFEGNNSNAVWTTFYARSTDNGATFEPAQDLNKGIATIEGGLETVAAANNNIYIVYQGSGYKFYFSKSTDGGANFSEPVNITPTGIANVDKTNLPSIIIDNQDPTGKTFYIAGNWLFSVKSTDGGNTFTEHQMLLPSLQSTMINLSHNYAKSYMALDNKGQKHWISMFNFRFDPIFDVYYRNIRQQSEPGETNKSFYVETLKDDNYKYDQIVIPDNPSIKLDSTMTVELWLRFRAGVVNDYNLTTSIFAKINGSGLYDSNPSGYQLAFRDDKKTIELNAGLKTDKGEFVNWSELNMNDNLWHHVAITYDARAGKDNFKIYINGLLNKYQTVTGKIYEDVGMLILGSSNMTNTGRGSKYEIDDFRLWNKTLSQEEIIGNQTAKLTGQEEGLLLFLNFDDTYKDLTGRGNDGIPVYDGRLEQSDFDAPTTQFDLYQTANEISLNNKTANATGYSWNFGDGQSTQVANPRYTYPTAGEYQVSLLAQNTTTQTTAVKAVSILGLDRVEPTRSGNNGFVTLSVFGGGITAENSRVLLRKSGATISEIEGTELFSPAPGELSAQFFFSNAEIGKWDVVVIRNNSELLLSEAFQMEQATKPDPWVSLSGRSMVLFNMWQSYTISYGNNGNIDALGVPLNLVVSDIPGMGFEMIDFDVVPSNYVKENFPEIVEAMDSLFIVIKDYFGPGQNARFYPLIIPIVEANSTHSIRIRIKAPEDFNIECWTSEPHFFYDDTASKSTGSTFNDWPDEKTKLNACIAASAMNAMAQTGIDMLGMVLPLDCAYDVITLAGSPFDFAKPEHKQNTVTSSWLYKISSAALSCASDLTPIKAIKAAAKVASIVNNMYAGYKAHQDCLNAFDPRYKNKKNVNAVSSFDPNEMVGPAGFGPQNFIANYESIPYTILFENKKEATAPAHVVTITDTLDMNVFNVQNFGFGAFGWNDTILAPAGLNLKSFSMDVDLRPEMPLITRVSGKLDTITGIITWEFLSLNPETMDIEEDPFIGFLPPNATPPQGDGFVSFNVGLKANLKTNDELRNKATIVFDANPPIVTNEFLNTLDFDAPTSQVTQLKNNNFSFFDVNWTGADNGSGIQHYTIYVLENDTLLYNWLQNTTEQSGTFKGTIGSTYKFYSLGTDNVSLMEPTKNGYEAQTTVIVGVDEQAKKKTTWNAYPNPVKDFVTIQFNNPDCGVYVVEIVSINGARQHSALYTDDQMQQGISIDTRHLSKGTYLLRVISEQQAETQKLVIQ